MDVCRVCRRTQWRLWRQMNGEMEILCPPRAVPTGLKIHHPEIPTALAKAILSPSTVQIWTQQKTHFITKVTSYSSPYIWNVCRGDLISIVKLHSFLSLKRLVNFLTILPHVYAIPLHNILIEFLLCFKINDTGKMNIEILIMYLSESTRK